MCQIPSNSISFIPWSCPLFTPELPLFLEIVLVAVMVAVVGWLYWAVVLIISLLTLLVSMLLHVVFVLVLLLLSAFYYFVLVTGTGSFSKLTFWQVDPNSPFRLLLMLQLLWLLESSHMDLIFCNLDSTRSYLKKNGALSILLRLLWLLAAIVRGYGNLYWQYLTIFYMYLLWILTRSMRPVDVSTSNALSFNKLHRGALSGATKHSDDGDAKETAEDPRRTAIRHRPI